jgi:methionine sulfoxide reductase heme-binding subunit
MIRSIKVAVFVLCLLPVALEFRLFLKDDLGANPVEHITHLTGNWALRFLVITLCVTPLRKLLGQPSLIKFRRMLGLFAFFYACLHFTTYCWLYAWLEAQAVGTSFWAVVWADLAKRPYITMGFFGLLCLAPLAVTSTAGWIRRMGGKRWQMLHRLTYAAAVFGVIHYYWLVKSDVRKPLMYGAMVGVLLLFRAVLALRKRPISKPRVSSPSSAY